MSKNSQLHTYIHTYIHTYKVCGWNSQLDLMRDGIDVPENAVLAVNSRGNKLAERIRPQFSDPRQLCSDLKINRKRNLETSMDTSLLLFQGKRTNLQMGLPNPSTAELAQFKQNLSNTHICCKGALSDPLGTRIGIEFEDAV